MSTQDSDNEAMRLLLASWGVDSLDDVVHRCYAEIAANVNNEGIDAQIEALMMHGWSVVDVINAAREARGEAEVEV